MKRVWLRIVPMVLVLALGAGILFTIVRQQAPEPQPLATLASFQDADAPLVMPAGGQPDFRFERFSAWDRVMMPEALRFSAPLGAENGALSYDAQPFWEDNPKRGGHHTGDDLNGIGGMNSDLGDPVFAVADGLVVYAGEPSAAWGNIVVLGHRTADGRILQSLYAHLDRIEVPLAATVARGERIGTVGTANGHYPAHLHFEIRAADGVAISGAYREQPLDCLPPAATLAALGMADGPDLAPAALTLVRAGADFDLGRFEFDGDAERVLEIFGSGGGEQPGETE